LTLKLEKIFNFGKEFFNKIIWVYFLKRGMLNIAIFADIDLPLFFPMLGYPSTIRAKIFRLYIIMSI